MGRLIDLDRVAVEALPRLAVERAVVEVRLNGCMVDQSIIIEDSKPKSSSLPIDTQLGSVLSKWQ